MTKRQPFWCAEERLNHQNQRDLMLQAAHPTSSRSLQPTMAVLASPLIILGIALILSVVLPDHFSRLQQELSPYFRFSRSLSAGQIPYLDFQLEYPPLALAFFHLPQFIHFWAPISFGAYCLSLFCLNAIFSLVIGLTILHTSSPQDTPKKSLLAGKFLLLLALCTPISLFRFDVFPALLTALAVFFYCRQRPFLAGACFAFGTLAKLYPVVLLPLFLIHLVADEKQEQVPPFLAGLAVPLLFTLPLFLHKPAWPFDFLGYHLQRGLQLESTAAGILLLWHIATDIPYVINFGHGAQHLLSPLSQSAIRLVSSLAPILMLCALRFSWSRFRLEKQLTGRIAHATLHSHSFLLVLLFILTSKVFSPQYIVWLLPFAANLGGQRYHLTMIFFAITVMIYPYCYPAIINGTLAGAILINFRNALTGITLGALFLKASIKTNIHGEPQLGNDQQCLPPTPVRMKE